MGDRRGNKIITHRKFLKDLKNSMRHIEIFIPVLIGYPSRFGTHQKLRTFQNKKIMYWGKPITGTAYGPITIDVPTCNCGRKTQEDQDIKNFTNIF